MISTKSIIAGILSVLLIFVAGIPCSATHSNTVYTEHIITQTDTIIEVPVYIAGNTGLMGFAIEFEYDEKNVTPIAVQRGQLLTSGLFENSIGTEDNNHFKVIWSNTADITQDGELFTITFSIAEDAQESIVIRMSFSSKDTFNEKWEKVHLNCNDITIEADSENQNTLFSIMKKIMDFFIQVSEMIRMFFH